MFEQHIQNLKSQDAAQQIKSIKSLGESGNKKAVEPLIGLLKNSANVDVRIEILNVLGSIRDPKSIDSIKIMSFDSNETIRINAITALSNFSAEKEAVDNIIAKLKDYSPNVRSNAIRVLGKLQISKATPDIVICLNEPALAPTAAEALANIKDKKAIKPLVEALLKHPAEIKKHMANALTEFGIKVEDNLIPLLSINEDPTNLIYISKILGDVKSQKAIYSLIELFSHPNTQVKDSISAALTKIPESFDLIMNRFQADPTNTFIVKTLSGLGKVATNALCKLKSETEDENLRQQIDLTLTQIKDKYLPYLSSPSEESRLEACEIFAVLREPGALTQLTKLLTDPNGRIRRLAVRGLRLIKSPDSFTPLFAMVNQESEVSAIIEGIQALGEYPENQEVIDLLIKETRNRRSPKIRIEAIKNLVKVKGEKGKIADAVIERVTDDPEKDVKLCAIEEIGKIADNRSIEPLKELLVSADKNIAEKTREALRQIYNTNFNIIQDENATEEQLIHALDAFSLLGEPKIVQDLIEILNDNPTATIRAKSAQAIGSIRDVKSLPTIKEILQKETNQEVRNAIENALALLEGKEAERSEEIDKLRSGNKEFTPLETLSIIKGTELPFPNNISSDIVEKLEKAILHYKNKAYSDCIIRINATCEALVKALFNERKSELKIDQEKFERLMKSDHANRIGKIKDTFGDALYSELLAIHQHRLQTDAPHAGGKAMTVPEANLVIQLFRSVYFKIEKLILKERIRE